MVLMVATAAMMPITKTTTVMAIITAEFEGCGVEVGTGIVVAEISSAVDDSKCN